MSRIIAIANPKGGTAKTVTALSLCSALAHTGRRVLLCDLDPQGFAGAALGIKRPLSSPLGDALLEDKPLSADDPLKLKPFHLLQGCDDLTALQAKGSLKRLCPRLKHVLEPIEDKYDFIFIDCPPTMGILTLTGLCAADFLIVPTHCEMLSLLSIDTILKECRHLKDQKLSKILLLGIVRTMFDENSSSELFNKACADLKRLSSLTFNTIIPYSQSIIAACAGSGDDVFFNKHSKGLKAYMMLAGEILQKLRRLKEQSEIARDAVAGQASLPDEDAKESEGSAAAPSQDGSAQTGGANTKDDTAPQTGEQGIAQDLTNLDETLPKREDREQSLTGPEPALQPAAPGKSADEEPEVVQGARDAGPARDGAQDVKEAQTQENSISHVSPGQGDDRASASDLAAAGSSQNKDGSSEDKGKPGSDLNTAPAVLPGTAAAAFANSDTLQRLIRRSGLNQQRIKDHAQGLRVMRSFDLKSPSLNPALGIASFKRPDLGTIVPKVNSYLQNEAALKPKAVSLENPVSSAWSPPVPAMMHAPGQEQAAGVAGELEDHAPAAAELAQASDLAPGDPGLAREAASDASGQNEPYSRAYPGAQPAVPQRPGRRQARAALDQERGALNPDDLEVLAAIATLDQSEVRSTLQEQRQRQSELDESDFDPAFDNPGSPTEYTIDDLDALQAQMLEEKREDLIKEQTLQFERTLNQAWDDATKITRQSTQAVQQQDREHRAAGEPSAKEDLVDWEQQFYAEEDSFPQFAPQDNPGAAIGQAGAEDQALGAWESFDDDLKIEDLDEPPEQDEPWSAGGFDPGLDDYYQSDDESGFEDLSADDGIEALDDGDEAVEILYDPASKAATGPDARPGFENLEGVERENRTKLAKPGELMAGRLSVEDFERMLSEP